MELDEHVLCAIDDHRAGKLHSALMHACIAIEGTARKLLGEDVTANTYKKVLRQYYWVLEPMIGAGLNLEETIWNNLEINNGRGKRITNPNFADIIYHIFRCNTAHAKPVPPTYQLLPVSDGYSRWVISHDSVHMPERVIWALLAVSVFSEANLGIKTEGAYYLTWGSESLGIGLHKFTLKDWWGRESDFRDFMSEQKIIRVKLDRLDRLVKPDAK